MALAEANETKVATANSANLSANKRRKKKTRKEKQAADEERSNLLAQLYADKPGHIVPTDVKIEYVEQQPSLENTEFADYSAVFSQFATNAAKSFGANEDEGEDGGNAHGEAEVSNAAVKAVESRTGGSDEESEASDGDNDDETTQQHSSRKQKKNSRISVAELKQIAPRPEVVEWTDVSARDPGLLVALKATRNTVPVPIHWSQKKKYLQYKRGMEKPPFDLPDFIKATGIMEMREA
ncbi:hypothetical protein GGI24_006403, partial [Coemansia furcata]